MAEMVFADEASRKTEVRSSEMVAASENLDSFASGLYIMMYGEEE
jgi:hypothetical protein